MSKRHAQLALFAAIDEAVLEKPSLREKVGKYLPGTYGRAGWSRELLGFMNEVRERNKASRAGWLRSDDPPVTFPGRSEAFAELIGAPADDGAKDSQADSGARLASPLRDPAAAGRALYALNILKEIDEQPQVPSLGKEWDDFQPREGPQDAMGLYLTLLAPHSEAMTADPGFVAPTCTPDELDALKTNVEASRNVLDNECKTMADFAPALQKLTRNGAINPDVARTKICTGRLREINGEYCTVLTTDFTRSQLSLGQMKRVINPRNWSLLSTFFCQMEPRPPEGDWSRVREHCSTECKEYQLDTDLRYWQVAQDDGRGIYINYDLAKHRNDLGLVQVDNGYIWITPTADGVRVRTGKQARIGGLSPTAMAALACLAGWADAGEEMLCDRVLELTKELEDEPENGRPTLAPFRPSPDTDPGPASAAAQPSMVPRDATLALQPRVAKGFREDVIDDVAEHADEFLELSTYTLDDARRRWLDGLSRDDIKTVTTNLGTLLRRSALNAFDSAMSNFQAKNTPRPKPTRGKLDAD